MPEYEVIELDVEHIELQPLHEQPTNTLLARITQLNAISVALNAN
jgi:hypothetical protein